MKSKKMTQAELAVRIGTAESTLSRFLRGDTDKLGNENIIRIARVFNVSTDFLLGEVDVPDRMNYDISELGLSVQVARNLYTHKVNPQVVNALLENPEFANTTNLISRYLDDELAKGFAAQNQLYATVAGMLSGVPESVNEVKNLQVPVYQFDLTAIQRSLASVLPYQAQDNSFASSAVLPLILCNYYIEEGCPNRMCGSVSEYVCRLRFSCFAKSLMNIRTRKPAKIVRFSPAFSFFFRVSKPPGHMRKGSETAYPIFFAVL